MLKTVSLAALFPLVAEMSAHELPDPNNWVTLGWVVAAIFGVVGLANQGLELWRKLFPPHVPPLHDKYASKEELLREIGRIETDFEAEMGRIEGDVDEDMTRVEQAIREGLGRLEKTMREEISMEKSWQKTIQDWQQQIERAMGHVETKADQAMRNADAAMQLATRSAKR